MCIHTKDLVVECDLWAGHWDSTLETNKNFTLADSYVLVIAPCWACADYYGSIALVGAVEREIWGLGVSKSKCQYAGAQN